MERRTKIRVVACSLGAIVAPYLTLSIFIVVWEWLKDFLFAWVTPLYVGIPLSIVIGVVFILLLHLKLPARVLVLVLYIALQAYLLFFFAFGFACIVYRECL